MLVDFDMQRCASVRPGECSMAEEGGRALPDEVPPLYEYLLHSRHHVRADQEIYVTHGAQCDVPIRPVRQGRPLEQDDRDAGFVKGGDGLLKYVVNQRIPCGGAVVRITQPLSCALRQDRGVFEQGMIDEWGHRVLRRLVQEVVPVYVALGDDTSGQIELGGVPACLEAREQQGISRGVDHLSALYRLHGARAIECESTHWTMPRLLSLLPVLAGLTFDGVY